MDRLASFAAGAVLLLGVASCAHEPQRFSNLGIPVRGQQPDLSGVSVTLSRSKCLGSCPDYEVTLAGTGNGTFVGRLGAVATAPASFAFQAEDLLPILDTFESMDFMNQRHRCEVEDFANDGSFATTTLTINGRSARFRSGLRNPIGGAMDLDHRLLHRKYSDVTDAIDRASDALSRWIGCGEELLARARQEFEERRKAR